MRQPVSVSLLNQNLLIQTDTSEEQIEKVAGFVNEKIHEIQQQTRKASSLHVALLACLDIADEYLRHRENKKEIIKKAGEKVQNLLEIVDLKL